MNYKITFTNVLLLVGFVLVLWWLLQTVGLLDSFKGEAAVGKSMKKAAIFLRKRGARLPNKVSKNEANDDE